MRIARKLTLLLTMAIAAMALAASTASADEIVTVVNEPGGACNPCNIHVAGESSLAAFHVITVSNCTDEFAASIQSNGTGQVNTWNGVNDRGNACTREQCRVQPGNTVRETWPFTSEEIGSQTVELNVEFCLSPVGTMTTKNKCDVPAIVTEGASHDYEISLSHECDIGGTPVEVHGDWHVEGTSFEFVHQP
jgi:hypothetical protein